MTMLTRRVERSSIGAMASSLHLILLLSNGIIASIGSSSVNNGLGTGTPSIANVATVNGASLENDRGNGLSIIPQGDQQLRSNNIDSSEKEKAIDVPITDAASAMAAKYAAANIVTGNIIDNEKANSTPNEPTSGSGGGGWFGKILGKGSFGADNEKTVASKTSTAGIPPPPPPPPMQQQSYQQDSQLKQSLQQKQQQPPQGYNSYSNYPPYNPPQSSYIDPAAYQNLLYELDESTLREMTLTHQLHNISAYVDTLTSESENLVMRIDVLTERLADSNANFNFVHNRNLELEKNCTALAATVESLQDDIASQEAKMTAMEDVKAENEKIMAELRGELRRVTDELEQLACLVETERFEMEKSEFLKDFKRKQALKRRKKRGFWAWLFGFDSEDKVDDSVEGEQERLRAAQELARSTLLHALQTERASVEELEASLITLQRNNSAIMDVVQSRNSLINELNDRVAVFEEDKMVLKAALRQLQKEIREEAPKLEKAQEGERHLREQLEQLKQEYQEDSEMWQQQYEEGEADWNRTKAELMLIGTYVDQLEDRLATFAIAKKEIELREKQCEELEAEAAKHKKEAESWKSQVEALAKEQGETKPLLEDLVKERAQTRVKMDGLLNEIKDLRGQIDSWKQKVAEVEQHSEEIKSQSARQLFLRVEESKREWEIETARRIGEQKQRLEAIKARELQEILETERLSWQAQSAREFEQQLAHEKADLEDAFQDRQSQLQTSIVQEWSNKLEQQKIELEARFQSRLESERLNWQSQKEEKIVQRLSAEKLAWETTVALKEASDSSSFEDEVERAATKVYNRLEKAGVSFETAELQIEPAKDLVKALGGFDGAKQVAATDNSDLTSDALEQANKLPEESWMTSNTTSHNATTTKPAKHPRSTGRNVPFRSVRKTFSRATGMHGIFSPSTVQLRQRAKHPQRRPKKRSQEKKQPEKDDDESQKDENTPELAIPQASTDAEVENQLWDNESEDTAHATADILNGSDEYYQQDNSWGYDSEGGVELMSLMEPPPLPDFDDR